MCYLSAQPYPFANAPSGSYTPPVVPPAPPESFGVLTDETGQTITTDTGELIDISLAPTALTDETGQTITTENSKQITITQ